jgi:hypothetical protein
MRKECGRLSPRFATAITIKREVRRMDPESVPDNRMVIDECAAGIARHFVKLITEGRNEDNTRGVHSDQRVTGDSL